MTSDHGASPARFDGRDPIATIVAREADVRVGTEGLIVLQEYAAPLVLPWDRIRLVQIAIERLTPVSLVIVPEWPIDPPQLLTIDDPATVETVAGVLSRVVVALSTR